MKTVLRILAGIVGVIVMILGILQIKKGIHEMSGNQIPMQPQAVGEVVALPAHGCSLKVPKGWEKGEASQGGTMFKGPKQSGVNANFIVASQPYAGTVRQYADENIKGVKAAVPAAKFVSDAPFSTDSGAPSYKVTFNNAIKDLQMVQAMYFFDGEAGNKIVITTTAPAAQAQSLEGLFDSCMKTVTIVPGQAAMPPPQQPEALGDRVTLPAYGCSLRAPADWKRTDDPKSGTIFKAPNESGANFIVLSEAFAGTLRQYADANIKAVKAAIPAAVFVSDAPFKAESGAPSFKVAFDNKTKDRQLAQAFYFFDGPPGKKIVITTTAPSGQNAAVFDLFDACMKTVAVAAPVK